MAKERKPKVQTIRGLTPIGMASFPNLFTPKTIPGKENEEPKFRVTLIWKPSEFTDVNKKAFNDLVANVNEVCRLELHKTFSEEQVAAFEAALKEHADKPLKAHFAAFKCLTWFDKELQGDRSCRSPFLLGKNDEYVDDDAIYIRLQANAQFPPDVVGPSKEPLDEADIYGGALIRCSYTAYPYNNMGNRGVTLYLGNVQKTGAGTRIGGGPSAADEFNEVEAEEVAF